MSDPLAAGNGIDFLLDLRAQLERAARSLAIIEREFENTAPGSELSREGRIETKEFIANLKHVLDQVTVRVWDVLVAPELPDGVARKRRENLYYPYAPNEQMFRSTLGKAIELRHVDSGALTPGEEVFSGWLRATQPMHSPKYRPLFTLGLLSKLPHRKLIDQRKACLFNVEVLDENGGGASVQFKDKPARFSVWTYRDERRVASGIGACPIAAQPNSQLTVFNFDPDTMDFAHEPGAKTSVFETLECRVEELDFDALPVFGAALAAATRIVDSSAFIFGGLG